MNSALSIACRVSPVGEGGIHLLWILGERSEETLLSLLEAGSLPQGQKTRLAHLAWNRERIDEVLLRRVLPEEVGAPIGGFEISTHGSMAIVSKLLGLFQEQGFKVLEQGELYRFLFQESLVPCCVAESWEAFLEAKTETAARFFLRQVRALPEWKAAGKEKLLRQDRSFFDDCRALLQTARWGIPLANPKRIAIAGRPNAGKSTLLNAWLGYERVIVSPVAGTTRDPVREQASLCGYPVQLMDTAGFQETQDVLEKLSLDRAREQIDSADLLIWVHDCSSAFGPQEREFLSSFRKDSVLIFQNKTDLIPSPPALLESFPTVSGSLTQSPVQSLESLERKSLQVLGLSELCEFEQPGIFHPRQHSLIQALVERPLEYEVAKLTLSAL